VTETGFGLVIGFINYSQVLTTINYNTVTNFHSTSTPRQSSQSGFLFPPLLLVLIRTDHAQKTRFYCCARNIAPRRSDVTPSQYCWSCDVMRLRGSVFTEPWPRNGTRNSAFPLLVRVLLRNGWFCGSTFLAWSKYATICILCLLNDAVSRQ
jgi:hypothetical protein